MDSDPHVCHSRHSSRFPDLVGYVQSWFAHWDKTYAHSNPRL